MDPFHRNSHYSPPYHEEAIPSLHSPHQPIQSPLQPHSVHISREILLYDHLDDLGSKFAELGRCFNYVGSPYPETDYGDFSHIKLIMATWNDELQEDRETWEGDLVFCSLVCEVDDTFRLAHCVLVKMRQKEEEREKQRHFEENLARQVVTARAETVALPSPNMSFQALGSPLH